MKGIKVNLLIIPVFIITYLLGISSDYLRMFIIILIHETGHLILICLTKIDINFLKIEPFGMTIRLKSPIIKSPAKEILIALAGPFTNFLLAFICYIFKFTSVDFIFLNLSIGLFNLLPAYPLDGGRILKAFLCLKYGYLKSYRLSLFITKIMGIILIVSGFILITKYNFNFSLCLIGCFLLFNILTEKNYTYFFLLKEVSEYKEKEKEIDKIPVYHIAVNKNFYVRDILCDLSFTKYTIINVIEKGKTLAQFTESQLIDSLINYGARVKISKLLP